jgi:hypothetical protein
MINNLHIWNHWLAETWCDANITIRTEVWVLSLGHSLISNYFELRVKPLTRINNKIGRGGIEYVLFEISRISAECVRQAMNQKQAFPPRSIKIAVQYQPCAWLSSEKTRRHLIS